MWETDELGTRRWIGPEGWSITVYPTATYVNEPPRTRPSDPDVIDVEIDAGNSHLTVYGEHRSHGWDSDSPARVELPFELLAEVLRLNGYTVTRNE